MALPNSNITTEMVRNELGAATNSVGKLCTHPNINMWSKRKPVRDSRLSIPANEVGVGSAQDYGLNIPAYQGDDSLLTTYKRPTGGSASPYRLGDFRGYDHSANLPVVIQPSPAELEKRVHNIASIVAVPEGSNVTIGDIPGFLGNLRIGVMVYQSGGGLIGAASGENPGDGVVTIDLTGLVYSSLDLKFCLTDYHKAWETPGGMTALFEIPREYLGQNQNWTNIQLVTYVPPTQVSVFNVLHNSAGAGSLDIGIETLTYSGPIYIQYLKNSDLSFVGYTSGKSIPTAGSLYTFSEGSISWLVPGTVYRARVWLHSTAVGAFDKEVIFTAFLPI